MIRIDRGWWSGKRVFLTGHTGFKGSWLSLWLTLSGAEVHGYSLPLLEGSNLFTDANVASDVETTFGDVRDLDALQRAMRASRPEVVIHMAAQPLVRRSYEEPVATFDSNVMGTVHLLEAVRHQDSVRSTVVVTSDKCYQPSRDGRAYCESDPMGGDDPYSASKGCAELVTHAYRASFFCRGAGSLASARAGNVVGGGDWALDRLVPDMVRAMSSGVKVDLRYPDATRPWQHVLEPLSGYLTLARKLWEQPVNFAAGWNFGPAQAEAHSVREVVTGLEKLWKQNCTTMPEASVQPDLHEAMTLQLDSTRSQESLGWRPRLDFQSTLAWTARWYCGYLSGENARDLTVNDIHSFQEIAL